MLVGGRRYDCIWIQWCLLYVTDADVPPMMERAKAGLKPGGLIVVKENVCKEGFVVDNDDSSLTRSNAYLLELFEKSGLKVRACVWYGDCGLRRAAHSALIASASASPTSTPSQLLLSSKQRNFPKDLFDVRMYVLQPK